MIQAVAKAIQQAGGNWLLASHENPDGDAVGSLLGLGLILEGLGRRVTLLNVSGVPHIYRFLPGAERILREISPEARFDGLIVLDSGDVERIGPAARDLGRFSRIVNIDHHLGRSWGDPAWVDTAFAAVGEMIFLLAEELGGRVSPEAALNLYTAVMTDTGSFRYSNTQARTLLIAGRLVELGADPARAAKEVYLTFAPGRLKLLGRLLESLELLHGGRIGLLAVTRRDFEATGTSPEDLEGFVDFARGVPGVELAALMRPEAQGHKFSLRSNGRVNVALLAGRFGGGGHRTAAGMTIPKDENGARREFLRAAAEMIG